MSNSGSSNLKSSLTIKSQNIIKQFPDAIALIEKSGNEVERMLVSALKKCAEVPE